MMQKSFDTLVDQRRIQYRESLERALTRIVNHLSGIPEVELVVLFGSYASGRQDLFANVYTEDAAKGAVALAGEAVSDVKQLLREAA